MWGLVIMKKIIISEEQYLRLFLNEQTEIPDFTELEKKYENLLYEMQVMKGSALGPKELPNAPRGRKYPSEHGCLLQSRKTIRWMPGKDWV